MPYDLNGFLFEAVLFLFSFFFILFDNLEL